MPNLTKREAQIVALIAEGKSNVRIAAELGITTFTVGKHRNNISRKFDLHATVQLVSFAVSRSPPARVSPAADRTIGLTRREREILRELAHGRTSKEIARHLEISPRTVGKHIENIKEKSQCKSLAELMWMSPLLTGEPAGNQ
jgi:DNA-binding CsgD family transcriptional regulator